MQRKKADVAGCREMWGSSWREGGGRSRLKVTRGQIMQSLAGWLRNLGFIIKAVGNHRQVCNDLLCFKKITLLHRGEGLRMQLGAHIGR